MLSAPRTRILLADDHAVLRAGLKLLINAQPDMETIAEACDGVETLAQAEANRPDLILLDLNMPIRGGLAILQELRSRVPAAQLVVLTMYGEEEYLREALQLGARGYVVKAAADQELLAAIRAVMRGELYIHPSMTHFLLAPHLLPAQPRPQRAWEQLSEREQQVIQRVALGYTNREIGDLLGLSTKTVETYRARAMEKLDVQSRSQLVAYMTQHNLLDPVPSGKA